MGTISGCIKWNDSSYKCVVLPFLQGCTTDLWDDGIILDLCDLQLLSVVFIFLYWGVVIDEGLRLWLFIFQHNLHDPTWPQLCWRGGALEQRLPGRGEAVPAGQRGHQPVAIALQLLGEVRPSGQPQPQLQVHKQCEVSPNFFSPFDPSVWCHYSSEKQIKVLKEK